MAYSRKTKLEIPDSLLIQGKHERDAQEVLKKFVSVIMMRYQLARAEARVVALDTISLLTEKLIKEQNKHAANRK